MLWALAPGSDGPAQPSGSLWPHQLYRSLSIPAPGAPSLPRLPGQQGHRAVQHSGLRELWDVGPVKPERGSDCESEKLLTPWRGRQRPGGRSARSVASPGGAAPHPPSKPSSGPPRGPARITDHTFGGRVDGFIKSLLATGRLTSLRGLRARSRAPHTSCPVGTTKHLGKMPTRPSQWPSSQAWSTASEGSQGS